MQTGKEVRQEFIKFFEEKGHTHIESSSLVPFNDPTLLFTNAGMNQFKNIFLGVEERAVPRAVTSQKCVRAGGKHNDLETVGKTARHHTFFEMLGNFSFGDYFKENAIAYAWEFLTEKVGLNPDDLYITVFQDDDEAAAIWKKQTGFGDEKIIRLGEKDNFWQMGDVGPCGPCSEIHFDRGEAYACDHPDGCKLGVCDCDRWLEIWNLVFMQFNRDEGGNLIPLPNPSIDTGMGLERIASILQKVDTNYETDLIYPLIEYVEELSGKDYQAGEAGFAFRVIADHARACTFLIADGVSPSNEGRGYVLRRILRRAVRLGRTLGLEEAFLYKFVEPVGKIMGEDYPNIVEQADYIANVIKIEENRFLMTLQEGLKIVEKTVEDLKKANENVIPGKSAFMFYDTYGFPIDLTKDIADENGMTVDELGFDQEMVQQRERAKGAQKETNAWDLAKTVAENYPNLGKTTFLGYDHVSSKMTIQGILCDGEKCELAENCSAVILADQTPFYARGGGQVGDIGVIQGEEGLFMVEDTIKLPSGIYVHQGNIQGAFRIGEVVEAKINQERRQATARNHTATHLLHYVLRDRFGDSVHQAGSLVDREHLRFDFSYPQALSQEDLNGIERAVNQMILSGEVVTSSEMSMDEAKENGYTALFGEKYGDVVRCINAGENSKELCGGIHVDNLGQIGLFKITSESSVSAGVRRIEAVTGLEAYDYVNSKLALLQDLGVALKVTKDDEILSRIGDQDASLKQMKKELHELKMANVKDDLENNLKKVVTVNGINVLGLVVQAKDPKELRDMADKYKDRLQDAILVLGAVKENGEAMLVSMLTPDKVRENAHAGKIIKEVAALVDGKGGGRPDVAQAGGKDGTKLENALSKLASIVQSQMN